MRAIMRTYLHIAAAEGFRTISWRQNSHIKFKMLTPCGREVTVVASSSPSDWRAEKAYRSTLRKLAR